MRCCTCAHGSILIPPSFRGRAGRSGLGARGTAPSCRVVTFLGGAGAPSVFIMVANHVLMHTYAHISPAPRATTNIEHVAVPPHDAGYWSTSLAAYSSGPRKPIDHLERLRTVRRVSRPLRLVVSPGRSFCWRRLQRDAPVAGHHVIHVDRVEASTQLRFLQDALEVELIAA